MTNEKKKHRKSAIFGRKTDLKKYYLLFLYLFCFLFVFFLHVLSCLRNVTLQSAVRAVSSSILVRNMRS